jgi:hypothetical protein
METSEQRRDTLPIDHRALPFAAFLLASFPHIALSERIQCHGAVYVEKQCPPLEEMFLHCLYPQWTEQTMV